MRIKPKVPGVLIIDCRSQITQNIRRDAQELGYRTAVLPPDKAQKWLRRNTPTAIIVSGGLQSVYEKGALKIPKRAFTLGVPMLVICYGMQSVVRLFGGTVESALTERSYGEATIETLKHPIFRGTPKRQKVWMSHGDSVMKLPSGFKPIAKLPKGKGSAIIACANEKMKIVGFQYHLEATQTEYGKKVIANFFELAGCERDWDERSVSDTIIADTMRDIGDGVVVVPFSGGVDSSTALAMFASRLGKRLLSFTIDAGQLSENEIEEIRATAKLIGAEHVVIRAKWRFLSAIAHLTDAEKQRKAFQREYRRILLDIARMFGKRHPGKKVFIMQGTLAPDLIESGVTGADMIKTHHNVGMNTGRFVQLHPLGTLFKYEVRAIAKKLGLPDSVAFRPPSPGPGLYLRVEWSTPLTPRKLDECLRVVRWATARVKEVLSRRKRPGAKGKSWYQAVSQTVVSYKVEPRVVGQKGDGRVYDGEVVVRGLDTIDFMTGRGVHYPEPLWREVWAAVTQHRRIVGALMDSVDKGPRTTERK